MGDGNTKIIDYLEQQGTINKPKADELRVAMVKQGKTEEAVLDADDSIPEEVVAKAQAEVFNIPYVDLMSQKIPDTLLSNVDGEMLQRFKTVPFEQKGNVVKVAMLNPFDIQAIQALQTQYDPGTQIKTYIATSDGINVHLNRKMGDVITSEVSDAVDDVGDENTITDLDDEGAVAAIDKVDLSDAPVARIVNSILGYAVKTKTSDIHIEPMEKKIRVRFRIHGVMNEKLTLPKHLGSAIVSRIKILSDLKIDEKRIPQDGRFKIRSDKYKVDLRVSIMPTIYGEKVVMRLLETSGGVPALETTGLRGSSYKRYTEGIKSTNGIILVTGPTGSGKTRTLAGTLDRINTPDVNVISLENPVEIRVPGVTQVQINPSAGLTFPLALRSVLRQDPDKVMVGEIRDQETSKLAVEASLTGHLVLSTLHTNSAAAAIPRLIEMGIEPYLLAATLKVVVAQRLPRRVCKYCREAYLAIDEQIEELNTVLGNIKGFDLTQYAQRMYDTGQSQKDDHPLRSMKAPDGDGTIYLYKGKGCDRCGGEGYSGRVGVFEVLEVGDEIERLILNDAPTSDIHDAAVKAGMVTMQQDGYLKAIEGATSIEEVLRVTRE